MLETELPDSTSIIREGRSIAADIKVGRTAFMKKMGVSSEAEYKTRCIRDKKIMFHAHIGMSSWKSTAESLTLVHHVAEECGFTVDRAGICLDRRILFPESGKYYSCEPRIPSWEPLYQPQMHRRNCRQTAIWGDEDVRDRIESRRPRLLAAIHGSARRNREYPPQRLRSRNNRLVNAWMIACNLRRAKLKSE